MSSNITCALCGAEVIQEGANLKCQNGACRSSTPIDINAINSAISMDKYEATDEGSNADL